jgi:hypothetical protein
VVKPLFDLRNTHCIIAESVLNLPDCFTLESPSFWQNLMQYRCSMRSVILGEMQRNEHVLQHVTQ